MDYEYVKTKISQYGFTKVERRQKRSIKISINIEIQDCRNLNIYISKDSHSYRIVTCYKYHKLSSKNNLYWWYFVFKSLYNSIKSM